MSCSWYNPASYGSCAGEVAKSAASGAFGSIAQSFGQAAGSSLRWLWEQLGAATAVHLGGQGFDAELRLTMEITGSVAVALFVIQIIQSVLRREASGLARAAKGLVVAFIGGGVAVAVVNLLLGATDGLSGGVVRAATGMDLASLGRLVLGSSALSGSVRGSAALLLLSLACILAAVIVYAALVIRKVLVVVTAVFAPLAFAGSIADLTVAWTRRWIETTTALIASKLILVLIFIAGYGILIHGAHPGTGPSARATHVISGILVLLVAGLAPFMALRIVRFTAEQAHQLRVVATSPVGVTAVGRVAQRAAPVPSPTTAAASRGPSAGATGSHAVLDHGAGPPPGSAVSAEAEVVLPNGLPTPARGLDPGRPRHPGSPPVEAPPLGERGERASEAFLAPALSSEPAVAAGAAPVRRSRHPSPPVASRRDTP